MIGVEELSRDLGAVSCTQFSRYGPVASVNVRRAHVAQCFIDFGYIVSDFQRSAHRREPLPISHS